MPGPERPVGRRQARCGRPIRVDRVQVEIVLRGDVRRVRAEEAARQEKGPIGDTARSSPATSAAILPSVCSLSVPVRGQPAQGGAKRPGPLRLGFKVKILSSSSLSRPRGLMVRSQLNGSSRPSVPICAGTP